jgi:hypothetical protein
MLTAIFAFSATIQFSLFQSSVAAEPRRVFIVIASMRWVEQQIHFIDFEGSAASGILEYGVVTLRGGQIVETKTRLCRATGCVRPEDADVHGLREADVSGCAPFTDDWEYFATLRERGPLAAHYAGVENALLKAVWPYPRTSPDFGRPGEQAALRPGFPAAGVGEAGESGRGLRIAGRARRACGNALSAGAAMLSLGVVRRTCRRPAADPAGGRAGGGGQVGPLASGDEHAQSGKARRIAAGQAFLTAR